MNKSLVLLATVVVAACRVEDQAPTNQATTNTTAPGIELSLTRLDCGHADFKDMNGFFSDTPGVYPPGPGRVTDSCYLIRHGDQQMVWDTGLAAETKDKPLERGPMTAGLERTLVDQLDELGVKPAEVDVVGISHMHGDHTGQGAQFTNARLVIGKQDFELLGKEPDDSFKAWRGSGKLVTLATGDVDIFGDGSVVALHLPGHTPDHLALLLNLKSGPVLLSGDLYHSTISREKRSVPPFNTDRAQTLASMDKFEALAKARKAKVVIQHEPNDIAKLPAFPEAAH
jgi:N-acyl homoserine lactone hydrolase